MAIALIITDRDVSALQHRLAQNLNKQVPVWVFPEIPEPEAVEMAVVWKHPTGCLTAFPHLRLISSFGAGVEHLINDKSISKTLPLTRIVDESLSRSMRNYVLMAVLNIQRQFRLLQNQQQARLWRKPNRVELPIHIGVLGLGELGSRIAQDLAGLGFAVSGFSRRHKAIAGVRTYAEETGGLNTFISCINVLVNVLPRTQATEGILNLKLFAQLPKDSFLIQVGRGAQLVEGDLLLAIELGYIREAWLDVFSAEPLPAEHPFWEHDQIVVTPHIASVTDQGQAAGIIAENYWRMKAGKPLLFEVDRERGY